MPRVQAIRGAKFSSQPKFLQTVKDNNVLKAKLDVWFKELLEAMCVTTTLSVFIWVGKEVNKRKTSVLPVKWIGTVQTQQKMMIQPCSNIFLTINCLLFFFFCCVVSVFYPNHLNPQIANKIN